MTWIKCARKKEDDSMIDDERHPEGRKRDCKSYFHRCQSELAALGEAAVAVLTEAHEECDYRAGELVFHAGLPCDAVYELTSGVVALRRLGPDLVHHLQMVADAELRIEVEARRKLGLVLVEENENLASGLLLEVELGKPMGGGGNNQQGQGRKGKNKKSKKPNEEIYKACGTMKSAVDGKTYDDLIKAGKLPSSKE